MKNPVPKRYRLLKKYNGCLKQPRDSRDIVLGDIPYVPDPNVPGWDIGFDNEVKYGKLKREHQGSSLSCVGQGWSKYLEMINLIEEKHIDDLSARDIYSQIFLDEGGAYIRDGAKIAVNFGCCTEHYLLSYLADLTPPNEPLMRDRSFLLGGYEENRALYKSKRFVYLPTSFPLTDADWESVRQVIFQFGGFVSGYNRHCMYASAYKKVNGRRGIKFVNSYGEGSDRWWFEGDAFPIYDITFLVDLPNTPLKTTMYQVIKTEDKEDQYIVVDGTDIYTIPDAETRAFMILIKMIPDSEPEIVTSTQLSKYTKKGILPSKKLMDVLEPVVKDIYLEE